MSSNNETPGALTALVGALCVSTVVTLFVAYWYVTIPAAILLSVFIARLVRQRLRANAARVADLKAASRERAALLLTHRGAAYLETYAASLDFLLSGEAPSFAGFQRRLDVTRRTADILMNDLEDAGIVSAPTNGRRRATAVTREALYIATEAARDVMAAHD
jgi:hypothetical protein